jgi:hypothetical protein
MTKAKDQKKRSRVVKGPRKAVFSLGPFDDRQVLPFELWCTLNNFSDRTGRRILASGSGPRVTALSAHRIGIVYADNRRWQESRARA